MPLAARIRSTGREKTSSRSDQRGEAAQGNGIHAAKVRLLTPYFVSVSEHSATEGPEQDQTDKKRYEQLASAE